jgi:hypothetical protein
MSAAEPKRTYTHGKAKPIRAACASCNKPTLHDVLYTVTVESDDDHYWHQTWDQVLECRGCQEISFRKNWQDSEDLDYSDDGKTIVAVDHETLYPSRVAGLAPMSDSYLLPVQLRRIYEETQSALAAALSVLAGVGLRAIVETLCSERKAKGRNLADKIDDLAKQRVITPDGATILHSLRLMGNEAAHSVKPHKPDHLALGMRVVEHALQGVYILPRQAEDLPANRAGAQPKQPPF